MACLSMSSRKCHIPERTGGQVRGPSGMKKGLPRMGHGSAPRSQASEFRRASCAPPTWCDELNGAPMRRALADGERLAVLFQNESVARELEPSTPIHHPSVPLAQK